MKLSMSVNQAWDYVVKLRTNNCRRYLFKLLISLLKCVSPNIFNQNSTDSIDYYSNFLQKTHCVDIYFKKAEKLISK